MILLHNETDFIKSSDTRERKNGKRNKNGIIKKLGKKNRK